MKSCIQILVTVGCWLLTFNPVRSQPNLVPNPSFETYTTCPSAGSGWPNEINYATPWYNPNTSSPDYFNSCCTNGAVGVPINFNGYQPARTGAGYAGLYVYGINNTNDREYIQVQLLDTLKPNHKYCATFYVNLPINSNYHYAITEIGLLFSNNPIIHSNSLYFNYTPQITSAPGFFLTDSLNWMQISGTYTAVGGENYITIGNFKIDAATDTFNCAAANFSAQAYYFIDDVSVIDCTNIGVKENPEKESAITVSPNPSSGTISLKHNGNQSHHYKAEIFDMGSKLILSEEILLENSYGKLRLDAVEGAYILYLRDNQTQTISVHKLMVGK